MKIPTELVPVCPHCGKPLTMNLRSDDKFVEDEGWHKANERYQNFLHKNENQKIVFLNWASVTTHWLLLNIRSADDG